MSVRAVFDTNIVLSALLFRDGRLAWLRNHWRGRECVPLLSRATAAELTRVLAYPKFRLAPEDRNELLGDYLPWCEISEGGGTCSVTCRDPKDQMFLDLAHAGKAKVLVTGDKDLLSLAAKAAFAIESPDVYRLRTGTGRGR